jgi:hypothetical protein
MTRIRLILLSMLAVFAISAVASASASAACYKVAEAGTGNRDGTGTCTINTGATKNEYINVTKLETQLRSGEWCAEVAAGTGNYEDNKCTKKVAAKNFIKVLVPEFVHCVAKTGGKFAAGCLTAGTTFEKEPVKAGVGKLKFTDKEGVSNFYATNSKGVLIVFTCTADTSKGEITGNTTTAKVTVTFTGCTAKEGKEKACSANSVTEKIKEPAETIKTNLLKDSLGTVLKPEATSEVGEALEPEGKEGFVTLEAECLIELKKAQVSGSVIGEVTPINVMQTTGKLNFECKPPESETQKIQKFVGFPKDTLSDFANPACFESKAEITFEEPIEVAYP